MLRVRASFGVYACVRVCACVATCANRRRNAIKWKLLKKAKMRNENSRHTLHWPPSLSNPHSFAFLLFLFAQAPTVWPGSVCTACDFALITQKTCLGSLRTPFCALGRRCHPVFRLIFLRFSQLFLLRCFFSGCNLNLTLSRGGVAVHKAASLLLYRLNSNPKHVPTQSSGLVVSSSV